MVRNYVLWAAVTGALGLHAGRAAHAQETADAATDVAAGARVEEVVVTARRREENLQQVPTAVTAIGAQELADLQISNFGEVGLTVPNLSVQTQFGSGSIAQYALRGQDSGSLSFEADTRIGLYLDGVYLARPTSAVFDLADVCRLEVLRGPQGTLFGRNATGGAINFVTCDPANEFEANAEVGLSNYDGRRFRGTVDFGRHGGFSGRLTYLHNEHEGYVDNTSAGTVTRVGPPFGTITAAKTLGLEDQDAVALSLRYDNDDALQVDYRFDYTDKRNSQLGVQLLGEYGFFNPTFDLGPTGGAPPPETISTNRLDRLPLDFSGEGKLEVQGHALTVAYDVSDALTIKNIASYRETEEHTSGNDIDGSSLTDTGILSVLLGIPGPIFTLGGSGDPFEWISSINVRDQDQFSDELQFIGRTDRLDWIFGLFYFRETGDFDGPVFLFVPFDPSTTYVPGTTNASILGQTDYAAGSRGSATNESKAAYGHLDYRLTDALTLGAGVRYTKDDREEFISAAAAIVEQKFEADFDYTDWDVSLSYAVNDTINLYAKVSTAHLSGGILGGQAFSPEENLSYEVGLKSDLLDDRLRFNAAVFRSEVTDLQSLTFSPSAGTLIVNTGESKQTGFEFELTAMPVEGLTLTANYGYIDISFDTNLRPLAPRSNAYGAVQYDFSRFGNDSHLSLRVDAAWKDDANAGLCPVGATTTPTGCINLAAADLALDEATKMGARTDLGARISLGNIPIGGLTARLSIWGRNLLDEDEIEFSRDLSNGTVVGSFQIPRTYGLDVRMDF
jgi:iron complex outermembrane recepter protein